MATETPKIVQLTNKAGENIYPVVPDDGKATITMTDTDPGEGVALQENHFIAVYGDATKIQTADIANGAVTSDKIDCTTMPIWELFFTYTQPSNASTGVNIDVPIDLVNYRHYLIEGACEPISGNTSGSLTPRDGSKNTISTYQFGNECWAGNFANINRSSTEIVAYGQDSASSAHFKAEIFRANQINYPSFIAQGYGGGATGRTMAQNFQGRIVTSPSNVKYIRCAMSNPIANSWVKAYRLKEDF